VLQPSYRYLHRLAPLGVATPTPAPPAPVSRAADNGCCRRWGGPALATWHLAPVAPPDFFLDPALLEEAGAHGMASGILTTPRHLLPATAHLPPSGSWVQVPAHTCSDAAAPHAVGRSLLFQACSCCLDQVVWGAPSLLFLAICARRPLAPSLSYQDTWLKPEGDEAFLIGVGPSPRLAPGAPAGRPGRAPEGHQ
jgi:hypothetical protein